MENKLNTIDPTQNHIPETATIQKVISESDRLPQPEHERAVKAFYCSDSIASGIGKDFAFVEKIPQLISDIIDNKSWECLYVSRGVVTPYYCRYNKGNDSANFRAFISAKRPNGLETTIEVIDHLLDIQPEIQWKFRTIVYESRQGERNDLDDETYYSDYNKSEDPIGKIQKSRIRAANRAGKALPEVRELLDRGLISIDVAAKLGRLIKDLDNLTAEEREYIDKRDLIGLRIKQYINTNTIPEDEDKEPAYSRELNRYVKDLLGIKDRSKSVRMDNPKRAAHKLLEFYKGEKLKELIQILEQGLEPENGEKIVKQKDKPTEQQVNHEKENIVENEEESSSEMVENLDLPEEKVTKQQLSIEPENIYEKELETPVTDSNGTISSEQILTKQELAKRLGVTIQTLQNRVTPSKIKHFHQWTKNKDPDGIAWQKKKEGKITYFSPVKNSAMAGG